MTLPKPNKKIVLLTDLLEDLAGGAEKQIYELARGLRQRGHEVHVVSLDCRGEGPRSMLEAAGCHLHIFRVVRIYGLSGLAQGLRFYRFLKEKEVDALFTYHFGSDIWGTFWGHLAGVRLIFSNRRDMGFWRNGQHVAAYKLINRWVNKIVVVSNSIKDLVIQEEGVAPERIEVIYNGVHMPQPQKNPQILRRGLGITGDDIVILLVANLRPVKGHKYLLEAFASIAAARQDVKLLLVGRDDYQGEIHRLVEDLNLKKQVLFLGKRDDVADILKMADICVLPSLSEGMSNSILEYMASQKPVIASRVGGNPELVQNGHNGLLVDKENSQQLKEALLTLINDSYLRQSMGQTGLAIIRRQFSMETMVNRYELLFKGVRVLHLISSAGLFGAERVVLNLAAKSRDMIVFVGAVNNLYNPHLEIIEEARHLGLNTVTFDSRGKFDLATILAVRKFIRQNQIDLVHSHNYKSNFLAMWATRWTDVQWMATHHGFVRTDQKLKLYEKIDIHVLKPARKIVLVSSPLKEYFLKRQIKPGQLEIVDNGIPIENFDHHGRNQDLRAAWGLSDQDTAVLIVGRLAQEKGHDVFLKAAAQTLKSIPNIKFIIIGDGYLLEDLKKQTAELGLSSHVVFAGVCTDMPAVYAGGDIMVNASYTEGLPMTILEAMASRLPVIATSVGAVGDVIIHEKNGILLRPGDPGLLAAALLNLIQDHPQRQRLAQQAYQDVCDRFSDTCMAQKYQEVYADVIKSI